jgi:hypothetical protein
MHRRDDDTADDDGTGDNRGADNYKPCVHIDCPDVDEYVLYDDGRHYIDDDVYNAAGLNDYLHLVNQHLDQYVDVDFDIYLNASGYDDHHIDDGAADVYHHHHAGDDNSGLRSEHVHGELRLRR